MYMEASYQTLQKQCSICQILTLITFRKNVKKPCVPESQCQKQKFSRIIRKPYCSIGTNRKYYVELTLAYIRLNPHTVLRINLK